MAYKFQTYQEKLGIKPLVSPTIKPNQPVNNYQDQVSTATGSVTPASTPAPTVTNTNPTIPAGWDSVTYANFKKTNPTLEPTPEDTAIMQNADKIPTTDVSISPTANTDSNQLTNSKSPYDIQKLLDENAKIRTEYEKSLTPAQEEVDLQTQINNIKASAGIGINNALNKPEGLRMSTGEAVNIERKANTQLSTLADELGLKQTNRIATQTAKEKEMGFINDDIDLVMKVQDKIDANNQKIIDNANKLTTEAKDNFIKTLEAFKGASAIDPNTLDIESQLALSQVAVNAGFTPSLLFSAMKSMKDQQITDNYKKSNPTSTPEEKAIAFDKVKQRTTELFADGATEEEYKQMRQELIDGGLGSYLDDFDKFAKPLLPGKTLTPSDIKSEIVKVITPQKDILSKDESKIAAESQLKESLKLSADQSLPEAYAKAIEEALNEVYPEKNPWWHLGF